MPHYHDGREAKLGDIVRGKTYNRGGRELVGTVISITPGSESCNCIIAFIAATRVELPEGQTGFMEPWSKLLHGKQCLYGDGHGNHGHVVTLLEADSDYGETRAFALVHRPDDAGAKVA